MKLLKVLGVFFQLKWNELKNFILDLEVSDIMLGILYLFLTLFGVSLIIFPIEEVLYICFYILLVIFSIAGLYGITKGIIKFCRFIRSNWRKAWRIVSDKERKV